MRGVRRESAHVEREWQSYHEKCSRMCERQKHEGETGLDSASTSLSGQHTWDPLDVMGTRWNSGDLFSALSSFICLPAKRQRNNNEENRKPDQCTQFRDEKKIGSKRIRSCWGTRIPMWPVSQPGPPASLWAKNKHHKQAHKHLHLQRGTQGASFQ